MVKIFSIQSDNSTGKVADWLDFFGVEWERVNSEDFESSKHYINVGVDKDSKEQPMAIWFRKWKRAVDFAKYGKLDNYLEISNGKEFEEYSKYLLFKHQDAYWLNHPKNRLVDKLTQLETARTFGIKTPPTLYTNNKKDLISFKDENGAIITKVLGATIFKQIEGQAYLNYTSEVIDDDIIELEEWFYPSLFQKKIVKEFEIRSFFLEGEFYSMAIFSQSDAQTSVDFRHYNFEKPNRNIPFKLPNDIEQQLRLFMKQLEINCGSIDLICDTGGEFIFLEVNPLGQFGMTSEPCNYYLEKKIAQLLVKKISKNEQGKESKKG